MDNDERLSRLARQLEARPDAAERAFASMVNAERRREAQRTEAKLRKAASTLWAYGFVLPDQMRPYDADTGEIL